jgi:hypothetical protein
MSQAHLELGPVDYVVVAFPAGQAVGRIPAQAIVAAIDADRAAKA